MSKKGLKLLSKEEILGAPDRADAIVQVPEWGGAVRITVPSAWEYSQYQQSLFQFNVGGGDGKGKGKAKGGGEAVGVMDMTGANPKLAALCIVDENNERLFSADEVEVLGRKSHSALQRVVDAIRQLPGMGEDEVEQAEGN